MRSLMSKVFLAGAAGALVATPIAAQANTRAMSSPVFQNSAGMMQSGDSDDSSGGVRRDGRVWSDQAGAWVDAEGNRWLLDDGKWYPLRGKFLPALFLAALGVLVFVAIEDDPSSSNGAD